MTKSMQLGIQVVLAVVIVWLAFSLYRSITGPYRSFEARDTLTERTRERMAGVRFAMIRYEARYGRYPTTLDSLARFVAADPVLRRQADSLFAGFAPDSLPFSPRGGRFELRVNDTSAVRTYLLRDPRSGEYIGTVEPDAAQVNAASWE